MTNRLRQVNAARRVQQLMRDAPKSEVDATLHMAVKQLQAELSALRNTVSDYFNNAAGNYDAEGNQQLPAGPWCIIGLENGSGGALNNGDVVVLDTSTTESCTTTTTAGIETVLGAVASDSTDPEEDAAADGEKAEICVAGLCNVAVDADYAAISIGDFLVTHTTPKYARKADDAFSPGIFAVAMEAKASGTGNIGAFVFPVDNDSGFARLDAVNQPFTGDLEIESESPELRMTDTAGGEFTRITRVETDNAAVRTNRITYNSITSDVSLLLHGDGEDGGSVFTDSGYYSHTVNRSGAAITTQTDYMVFGSASLYNNGVHASNRLYVATHSSFDLGTNDFTIDFWYRPTLLDATTEIICDKRTNVMTDIEFPIIFRNGTDLKLTMSSDGSNFDMANSIIIGTLSLNTWQHVAVTRSGSNFYLFMNGVLSGNEFSSASALHGGSNAQLAIMASCSWSGSYPVTGYIDEFRILNGTAAWTSGFTPPTEAYSTETNTESTVWKSEDSTEIGDRGVHTWGDNQSRTRVQGRSIRFLVGGTEEIHIDEDGNLQLDDSEVTTSGSVIIDSDSNGLELGADQDCHIYHDGTNLVIDEDTGTVHLDTARLGVGRVATTETLEIDRGIGVFADSNDQGIAIYDTNNGDYVIARLAMEQDGGQFWLKDGNLKSCLITSRPDSTTYLDAQAETGVGIGQETVTAGYELDVNGSMMINDNVDAGAHNIGFRWGAGQDVSSYYDGTDFYIDAGAVAASDFKLDCGSQKTLELQSSVYDDLRTPLNTLKMSASYPPQEVSYKGGLVYAFEDEATNEDIVYFTVQLPHTYKEGTDIIPHVHWAGEDNTSADVVWKLTYSWANIGSAFPTETAITATDSNSTTTDEHNLAAFSAISGLGKTISSMLICSLSRNSTNAADTYTSMDAYLLEVDFHFQVNTLGSRQETVK